MVGAAVHEDRKFVHALAAGVAGLGQEAASLFDVLGDTLGRHIAAHAGGDEGVGRLLVAAGRPVDDGPAVDGQHQRPPDPRVLQRPEFAVEPIEIRAKPRTEQHVAAAARPLRFQQRLDREARHLRGQVHHARLVRQQRGVRLLVHAHFDAAQRHVVCVPVMRVLLPDHAAAERPRQEPIRPVRHDMGRQGPAVAVRLDRLARHRHVRMKGRQVQEVRAGLLQSHDQAVRPLDADAHLRPIGRRRVLDGGLIVRLGPADRIQHVGVLGGRLGAQHPPPRPREVVGRHGPAVAPPRLGPKVERVRQAVGGDVPPVSHAGPRLEGVGIQDGEALEQGACHPAVIQRGHGAGVERGDFGAPRPDQVGRRPLGPVGEQGGPHHGGGSQGHR